MNQDSIERDRLLTRLDANVEFLVDAHKNHTAALVDHAKVDDARFNTIDDTLKAMNKESAFFYGKVYGGSAAVGAIAAFLMKVMFK